MLLISQFYFTKKTKYNMKLDTRSVIIQNINGAIDDLTLIPIGDEYKIFNNLTNTLPACIHANGPTKVDLNSSL